MSTFGQSKNGELRIENGDCALPRKHENSELRMKTTRQSQGKTYHAIDTAPNTDPN